MRVFAILTEPASYTLNIVKRIYEPRGVDYVFIKGASTASTDIVSQDDVLESKSLFSNIKYVLRVLKAYDAVIINGYTGAINLLAIILNVLFFQRHMAFDSDTEFRSVCNPCKRLVKWLWLHYLFTRNYCYGFAGGNYGHKELFRHYGMKQDHIYLAPMIVDNENYFNGEVVGQNCQKTVRIGYVGRLIPLKQVDRIIEAFRLVIERIPNVQLVIVGEGGERTKLESIAKGCPVVFTGALFGKEKVDVFRSLDILVLYSSYESWGLVVNEALACGRPVIISDKVGARNDLVLGEPQTGLMAKWNDISDLADKMLQLATNRDLYRSLSANAIKRIKTWDYKLYAKQFDSWLYTIE